jgi:hypothetical protein
MKPNPSPGSPSVTSASARCDVSLAARRGEAGASLLLLESFENISLADAGPDPSRRHIVTAGSAGRASKPLASTRAP